MLRIIDRFPRIVKWKIRIFIRVVLALGRPRPSQKTRIDFMIFILLYMENCLLKDPIHYFPIWLRTSSNPADYNWFRWHTRKKNLFWLDDNFVVIVIWGKRKMQFKNSKRCDKILKIAKIFKPVYRKNFLLSKTFLFIYKYCHPKRMLWL